MLGISDSKAIYITTDEDDRVIDYLLNEGQEEIKNQGFEPIS